MSMVERATCRYPQWPRLLMCWVLRFYTTKHVPSRLTCRKSYIRGNKSFSILEAEALADSDYLSLLRYQSFLVLKADNLSQLPKVFIWNWHMAKHSFVRSFLCQASLLVQHPGSTFFTQSNVTVSQRPQTLFFTHFLPRWFMPQHCKILCSKNDQYLH